jgi:hypothetical protein
MYPTQDSKDSDSKEWVDYHSRDEVVWDLNPYIKAANRAREKTAKEDQKISEMTQSELENYYHNRDITRKKTLEQQQRAALADTKAKKNSEALTERDRQNFLAERDHVRAMTPSEKDDYFHRRASLSKKNKAREKAENVGW